MITGDTHPIEYKGKEAFWIANLVRLFFTSNSDWVVPTAFEDRRNIMLDVADTHANDIPYFTAMMKQLDEGGYAALWHYLKTFDLSKVDLRDLPKTQAYLDQKLASASAEDKWWIDLLMAGALPSSLDLRDNVCPKDKLVAWYVEHAKRSGVSHRASETKLSMFLN